MFSQQIDEAKLIHVLILRNPLSTSEYEHLLDRAYQLSLRARARSEETLRVLLVIHGKEPVGALVRQRIGEVEDLAPRWDIAMVTPSVVSRTIMTAVAWLAPSNQLRRRVTCENPEEAIDWLVSRGAERKVLDEMFRRAWREFETRGGKTTSAGSANP
ncbi:MAG: STAS/SEC14 domain-containing protein [Myxococcales bacterium]|nr:STAS/SEC14 domain-containing protein [Myxococcales bacterium]